MSLLDCFCASRTRVESLRPEKQSETSIHQYLENTPSQACPSKSPSDTTDFPKSPESPLQPGLPSCPSLCSSPLSSVRSWLLASAILLLLPW
ncbi:STE20-related kinase adapter protein beta [Apodemus speciosus]|uniref:STE20-related kinase adapter protein beta n=1 Tax=Apodemus speciosus TaxID=105296 RepID=A0ABQ0ED96_APOSI